MVKTYDVVVVGTGSGRTDGRLHADGIRAVRGRGRGTARPRAASAPWPAARPRNGIMKPPNSWPGPGTWKARGWSARRKWTGRPSAGEKRAFTDPIPAATRKGLEGAGIDFITGTAAFSGPDTLAVNGDSVQGKYFVLATGAHPMPLPFPGAGHLITSSDFLEIERLPPRLVFVGGGFISFEFAHFAARLGPAERVVILEAAPRPLGPFDAEMVEHLMVASRAEGIEIHTMCS